MSQKNTPSDLRAKVRARSKVYVALASGRLEKRPCEAVDRHGRFCRRTPVHAHHEDYSRPLDVVWLCRCCHARRHFQLNNDIPVPPLVFDRPGEPRPDLDW